MLRSLDAKPRARPPSLFSKGRRGGKRKHTVINGVFSLVGAERFELSTSCTPSKRATQAALRPDLLLPLTNGVSEGNGSGLAGFVKRGSSLAFCQTGKSCFQPLRYLGRLEYPGLRDVTRNEPRRRHIKCRVEDLRRIGDDSCAAHLAYFGFRAFLYRDVYS